MLGEFFLKLGGEVEVLGVAQFQEISYTTLTEEEEEEVKPRGLLGGGADPLPGIAAYDRDI